MEVEGERQRLETGCLELHVPGCERVGTGMGMVWLGVPQHQPLCTRNPGLCARRLSLISSRKHRDFQCLFRKVGWYQ